LQFFRTLLQYSYCILINLELHPAFFPLDQMADTASQKAEETKQAAQEKAGQTQGAAKVCDLIEFCFVDLMT
jgi:hypothetical protein